ALAAGAEIISLDVLDRETLIEAGRLIWERGGRPVFGLGSQGFEAALVAYWQASGLIPVEGKSEPSRPVAQIAGVSGSVSPATAAQIAFAEAHGFVAIRLDATRIVDAASWEQELGRAGAAALAALGRGRDPLVFSASGPDDPAVAAFREASAAAGLPDETVNERLGAGLGRVLRDVIGQARLSRAVISGGDTSGRAAAMLGIDALTAIAPVDPGSPLCRAHARDGGLDGFEIALKGGQVGEPDYFLAVKQGGRRT
ncbi:MAG: four-carbon acid sugar kinase family protein, partial [Acidisphaera sp.]|nr:four-carbon acid sugar kinase family protein [Acidisphaera sp.]